MRHRNAIIREEDWGSIVKLAISRVKGTAIKSDIWQITCELQVQSSDTERVSWVYQD